MCLNIFQHIAHQISTVKEQSFCLPWQSNAAPHNMSTSRHPKTNLRGMPKTDCMFVLSWIVRRCPWRQRSVPPQIPNLSADIRRGNCRVSGCFGTKVRVAHEKCLGVQSRIGKFLLFQVMNNHLTTLFQFCEVDALDCTGVMLIVVDHPIHVEEQVHRIQQRGTIFGILAQQPILHHVFFLCPVCAIV